MITTYRSRRIPFWAYRRLRSWGENLSVTGQLVARGDTSEVKAEWLYLSYQFNPNLRINVGRQRMPLFLYSDYMDVGYAYH